MEMYFKFKLIEEIIGYILLFVVVGFWVILIVLLTIKDKFDEFRRKREKKKMKETDNGS